MAKSFIDALQDFPRAQVIKSIRKVVAPTNEVALPYYKLY